VTYLVFGFWFLSLLWVMGELDRLFSSRFLNRFMPEMTNSSLNIWFIPPLISMVVPGSGQFINRQPLKALFVFTWPVWAHYLRPLQLSPLKMWYIILPWYVLIFVDALCTALLNRLRDHREEREFSKQAQANVADLSDYLERRRTNRADGNVR